MSGSRTAFRFNFHPQVLAPLTVSWTHCYNDLWMALQRQRKNHPCFIYPRLQTLVDKYITQLLPFSFPNFQAWLVGGLHFSCCFTVPRPHHYFEHLLTVSGKEVSQLFLFCNYYQREIVSPKTKADCQETQIKTPMWLNH